MGCQVGMFFLTDQVCLLASMLVNLLTGNVQPDAIYFQTVKFYTNCYIKCYPHIFILDKCPIGLFQFLSLKLEGNMVDKVGCHIISHSWC